MWIGPRSGARGPAACSLLERPCRTSTKWTNAQVWMGWSLTNSGAAWAWLPKILCTTCAGAPPITVLAWIITSGCSSSLEPLRRPTSSAVTADEVGRRSGSRDEEHPDVIIHARTVIGGAPAQVVQSIFGSQAQAAPELVSDQPIQTCAFVHFVEVRQGLSSKEHAAGPRAPDRGPIHIVQQP